MSEKKEAAKKPASNSYFMPVSGEITIRKPILIEGEKKQTFQYDMDEISWELQEEIEQRFKAATAGKEGYSNGMAKFEGLFWRLTGIAAIVAVNPGVTFDSFTKVKGRDLDKIQRIGETFVAAPEELLYPDENFVPSNDGTEKPTERQ